MIYTSENNWYSWQYGDGPLFGRQENASVFKTNFAPISPLVIGEFKTELLRAAISTLDTYPGLRPSVLFSGGADSELMLRSYIEIGANPAVYIFRYEKDYNLYDVSYAVTICSMLNVDYKIIDFNLEKFYENDAEKISELAQIDRPRALPYCKFFELVDGLPLLGASDLTLMRLDDNYNKQGEWIVRCWEHDIGWSKFIKAINRPAVAEWFKWTPGLVGAFLETSWCKRLVNDGYYGKLGTNSTKLIGYREAYPMLIDRVKKTGFEKLNDSVITEFENFLSTKYGGLRFRQGCDRTINEIKLALNISV